MNTYTIYDAALSRSARAQLRSVTEITLKSRFVCVNRSPIPYGFRFGAKAILYRVNTA